MIYCNVNSPVIEYTQSIIGYLSSKVFKTRAKNYYDLRKAAVIISTRDHAEDHAPSCTSVMSLTVDLHSNNLNSGERSSLNSGESE